MIYDKLYDWQKHIVDEFSWKHRFGLFLDMGLGKTPIALALAERNKCTKILVITINAKAIESETSEGSWGYWGSQSNINYNISNKMSSRTSERSPEIYLVNYESLFSRAKDRKASVVLHDRICGFINDCIGQRVAVIVDESHKMKSLQSMQTKAINEIIRKLTHFSRELFVYLLTGTPFTNGYIDLYSQLKTLGYKETKETFIDNFCERGYIPGLLGWQQPIVSYKNIEELFKLVHEYAITINSKDVVNLPEQIYINHTSKISSEFTRLTSEKLCGMDIYNLLSKNKKVKKVILDKYNTTAKVNNPFYRDLAWDCTKEYPNSKWLAETTGTFWLRARQVSIGFIGNEAECEWYDRTRLSALKEFLQEHPDNYLLFYNFTPELLELYPLCEELGYNIDVYSGLAKSLVFYEKYANQSDAERLTNKKNIILANFASGSTGLNWQAYNKCIIFSLPVYKDWAQGIKRIHRTGQKHTVIYHIFYQNNWLDRGMKKALEEGIDYTNDMFESDLKRVKEIIT